MPFPSPKDMARCLYTGQLAQAGTWLTGVKAQPCISSNPAPCPPSQPTTLMNTQSLFWPSQITIPRTLPISHHST